ncbi:hypothetical protein ZWY2020_006561 [Hordeum vulgare]|nr:hypothetical protein ZWY2020_050927 [Hordeum vulgare]KAI5016710.1 hypothetical protein ZWY2020_006561 [Hordeum vulgare]
MLEEEDDDWCSVSRSLENGNSVYAKVVDECERDSVHDCDDDHNYEPLCANNIVDASPAVWDALWLDQNVDMEGIT